ncbi:predicted protein [Naegleria gruberi]|uniref:Predicted protein n=1 Tax=Naegleria gruberi TaxID=5762 RepID=D2VDT0_NAEGR|nr:uncharacterized protein NAEGRDRAFT_67028 [Naegleria gruberi]EFC45053.1 predicted protein [Naegleria gruberi]|eukprot:XP_002677797.1 predicted protein [Naegleria gruberi strain NEG-M]
MAHDHHTPYYDIHGQSNNKAPTSGWESFKQKWKKFNQWTFGNRRLKMYIYSVLKMFAITYVQANSLIGTNSSARKQFEIDLQKALQIISYFYMAVLILMFTIRYIRELIAIKRKKPLTTWVNWLEAFVFLTYFIYSCFTAILHIVYIGKKYASEVVEREEKPEEFAHAQVTLEQELVVEILEVVIHMYIIADKGSHFLHSGHSVSLYLAKAQHIPKNAHPGHAHGHDDHSAEVVHHDYTKQEKDDEDYDDYVGKTTTHNSSDVVTSSNDTIKRRNTANFGQERLIDSNEDL